MNFRFEHINWESNEIVFQQQKTEGEMRFPLIAAVGNAIIDYLQYGRPETTAHEIIVSHESSKRGQKLREPTIHSIVTKYLRRADIENWQTKKHGAHSLRHSLATNMLKKNISLPIIAPIMGHQSTESTRVYLSLDIENLRICALPTPKHYSEVYK